MINHLGEVLTEMWQILEIIPRIPYGNGMKDKIRGSRSKRGKSCKLVGAQKPNQNCSELPRRAKRGA